MLFEYNTCGGKGSNFVGTIDEWNALTLAEKIEYDTADITPSVGGLRFSSDGNFTLSVSNPGWDGTMEYSTNGGDSWTTWDGSSISGTASQPIDVRGTGNSVVTGAANAKWTFTGKSCTGNIEKLLDYATVASNQHPAMGEACYMDMFYECTTLVDPPSFPVTTLTKNCYAYMFWGCTSLASTPTLSADVMAEGCYKYMFKGCTTLTSAPALPATTLAKECYYGMFYQCAALTSAPTLSVATMAEGCYHAMFASCTSLTAMPSLPATTLAKSCYKSMFSGCSALTTLSELSATTMANGCYGGMFENCTALVTPPELPATTLDQTCYSEMFKGCTNLETLPELPATSLPSYCYSYMFFDCSKIKLSASQTSQCPYEYRVPSSGTGTEATGSTSLLYMFSNTGGTFTGTPTVNTTYYTNHNYDENALNALKFSSDDNFTLSVGNPNWDGTIEYSTNDGSSWSTWDGTQLSGTSSQPIYLRGTGNTIVTGGTNANTYKWTFTGKYCTGNIETLLDYQTVANGQHPTMGDNCYCYIFNGCSSLVVAPELSATTLSQNCYCYMFKGCTSLTATPELPATTLAYRCYYYMFNGCTSLAIAPSELSATVMTDECCTSMFYNCSSLTATPELPATTLGENCYKDMFNGCTSLTAAPEIPATSLLEGCCYNMFMGCTSLATIPELPATTLANHCYHSMFMNCSALKISETQTAECQYEYRIPTTGTGTTATYALKDMFKSTGGTYTSDPTINTTYYTNNEPV